MKALLLLLIPVAVFAQPRLDACTGQPIPAGTTLAVDFDLTRPLPECVDRRPGSFGVNAAGIVEWDYCKGPDGRYFARRNVITRADIAAAPSILADALAAGWPRDITAEDRHRLAQRYAQLMKPMGHPENAAVWCPFREQIRAGLPVTSNTGWVVAKNTTFPTRPTYLVKDGRRQTVANGRANVGAACDMTGGVREGSTNYGYPDGAPANSVAVCVAAARP